MAEPEEKPPLADGLRRAGFLRPEDFQSQALDSSSEDQALRAGDVFGERLEIVALLGRGGMGTVYRARDVRLRRDVALKVLSAGPRQAERWARFEREGEVAAGLRHPGIVTLYGAGEVDGTPFLEYELVEDHRTLKEVLPDLDPRGRVSLVIEAARALGHAHARGVVHRDVKPANLLVDREGRLRVADFGLALAPGFDRLTATGYVTGTPSFMAPEQWSSDRERIGPATDVWALGVVLYEALTGEKPWVATNPAELLQQVTRTPLRPPRELTPSVSPALEAVVLRSLEKDPAARHPTGDALADDLERALRQPARARARARRLLPALGVTAGSVVAMAAIVAWDRLSPRLPPPPPPVVAPDPTTAAPPPPADATPPWVGALPAEQRPPIPLPAGLSFGPGPREVTNERDGSVLVWLAPGRFRRGRDGPDAFDRPEHEVVRTRGCFVGKHEVTWAQFRRFCEATGRVPPAPAFFVTERHPAHSISYLEAQAYCDWAGLRLPTEAEWEHAARGDDARPQPWGTQPAEPARAALLFGTGGAKTRAVDVGLAGASPAGCHDMVGNVWEWCDDWYGPYRPDAKPDPRGPDPAKGQTVWGDPHEGAPAKVIRGGSFRSPPSAVGATTRSGGLPHRGVDEVGFRVARGLDAPLPPLPEVSWQVRVFPWTADPREDLASWHRQAAGGLPLRSPHLRLWFEELGPGQLFDLATIAPEVVIPADRFGLTATAELELPAGTYEFSVVSDDGVRLFVGPALFVDDWSMHGPKLDQAELRLVRTGKVPLRVEYFELDGWAALLVYVRRIS